MRCNPGSRRWLPLVLAVVLLGPAPGALASVGYDITPITGGGYTDPIGRAMNDQMDVIGDGISSDGVCGFQWQNGTITQLPGGDVDPSVYTGTNCDGVTGDDGGNPFGINDSDLIAGLTDFPYSNQYTSGQAQQATSWQGAASPTDLGTGCTSTSYPDTSAAYAVNASGTVAGYYTVEGSGCSASISVDAWVGSPSNVIGTGESVALNDNGTVVIRNGSGAQLYSGGTSTALDVLPQEWLPGAGTNPTPVLLASVPDAINDSGVVVGSTSGAPAFSSNGNTPIDLPPADGDTDGIAEAVNASGTVVGESGMAPGANSFGNSVATIWPTAAPPATPASEPTGIDLNTLIPAGSGIDLQGAVGINSDGDILAWGIVAATDTAESVILTPAGVSVTAADSVPEPTSSGSPTPMTFTVSLPEAEGSATTVDYKTIDGTATTAANQYTAQANGSVTIPANQTSAQIQVEIDAGNGTDTAPSETFQVQLTSATAGGEPLAISAAAGSATGTITFPGIRGTITGKDGSPLAGAAVMLTGSAGSGQSIFRQVTTNSSGFYSINFDPGTYALTSTPPPSAPGQLTATECPGGTAIGAGSPSAGGCQLTVAPGAQSTINFAQGTLVVTAIKFQQLNLQSDEMEAVPASGTYDGNQVDVIATVRNNGPTAQTTNVGFGDPADDSSTVGITQSNVSVPAGASVNVDEVLDTTGLAWSDSGSPDSNRAITITLTDTDGIADTATLVVLPKPVILVHGWNSDASTWASYVGSSGFLQATNPNWRGYAVGDHQASGVMDTTPVGAGGKSIVQNAAQEATYIEGIRDMLDAAHVDIVAHSMGGLISRYYIQELMPDPPPGDSAPVVSHLVMLGTPNEGSNCAYPAFSLGDVATLAPNIPTYELTPAFASQFNAEITQTRGVKFSIMAGDALSASCTGTGPNDGVVPVPSAFWTIADRGTLSILHWNMTSSPLAFSNWVVPHLALGTAAAGGGQYTGPLVASNRRAARAARIAVRGAASDAKAPRATAATAGKLCLSPDPGGTFDSARSVDLTAGTSFRMAITVPAHAGELSVIVVALPTVTTKLIDPAGRIVETIAAGSDVANEMFRTLTASPAAAGTWHVEANSNTSGDEILIGAEFAHPTASLKLTMIQLADAGKHAADRTVLRFTARVTASGKATRGAHVTLELSPAQGSQVRLHLVAQPDHPGSYSGETSALATPAGAVVVADADAHGASSSPSYQIELGCRNADGA